uniref:Uncharacterized protein n=1 Tax=Arundo donax TaxID=35708 RepID=A0A0A8Y781_ARUDO
MYAGRPWSSLKRASSSRSEGACHLQDLGAEQRFAWAIPARCYWAREPRVGRAGERRQRRTPSRRWPPKLRGSWGCGRFQRGKRARTRSHWF